MKLSGCRGMTFPYAMSAEEIASWSSLSDRTLDFLYGLKAKVALLEAKLTAIECGDCGLTMLECKCDDLEDG